MTEKLRSVLADDEPLALDLLRSVLDGHPLVEVVAECSSGTEVVSVLAEQVVDLLFLDIEMPGLTGLEVVGSIDPAPMIVFATAHAEFAVEAFAANAVDYVLKPFEPERVLAALERACLQRPYRLAEAARGLVPVSPRAMLPVKNGGRTDLIATDTILWAEAAGDYAVLHAAGREHTIRVTLRELERELVPNGFLRVHRSALVRAETVVSVAPLPKGEAMLTLKDGTEVKASRTFRDAIVRLVAGAEARP